MSSRLLLLLLTVLLAGLVAVLRWHTARPSAAATTCSAAEESSAPARSERMQADGDSASGPGAVGARTAVDEATNREELPPRVRFLEGRVVGSTGRALVGAQVQVEYAAPGPYAGVVVDRQTGAVERRLWSDVSTADGDGRFAFDGHVAGGSATVYAQAPGHHSEKWTLEVPTRSAELVLEPEGRLAIRLEVDEPLAGVRLELEIWRHGDLQAQREAEAAREEGWDPASGESLYDWVSGENEVRYEPLERRTLRGPQPGAMPTVHHSGALEAGAYDVLVRLSHSEGHLLARVEDVRVDQGLRRDPRLDPLDLRGLTRRLAVRLTDVPPDLVPGELQLTVVAIPAGSQRNIVSEPTRLVEFDSLPGEALRFEAVLPDVPYAVEVRVVRWRSVDEMIAHGSAPYEWTDRYKVLSTPARREQAPDDCTLSLAGAESGGRDDR